MRSRSSACAARAGMLLFSLCVCYLHDGAVHRRGKAATISSEEDQAPSPGHRCQDTDGGTDLGTVLPAPESQKQIGAAQRRAGRSGAGQGLSPCRCSWASPVPIVGDCSNRLARQVREQATLAQCQRPPPRMGEAWAPGPPALSTAAGACRCACTPALLAPPCPARLAARSASSCWTTPPGPQCLDHRGHDARLAEARGRRANTARAWLGRAARRPAAQAAPRRAPWGVRRGCVNGGNAPWSASLLVLRVLPPRGNFDPGVDCAADFAGCHPGSLDRAQTEEDAREDGARSSSC